MLSPDSSSASSITAVDSTRKYGALSELSIEDSFFSGKEDTETASWRASDDEGILPFRFLKESPEALSSLHFYVSNVQVRLKEEEEENRRKQKQKKKAAAAAAAAERDGEEEGGEGEREREIRRGALPALLHVVSKFQYKIEKRLNRIDGRK